MASSYFRRNVLKFHYGASLLLIIHFHIQLDCSSLLSHSNSVVAATYLARYPNLHSFGLSHDYGLHCILIISNQPAPTLWCMCALRDSNSRPNEYESFALTN